MNEINLNFDSVANKEQLHALLNANFAFPDYYGTNLDALWDLLGGWIDTPVRIHVWGVSQLKSKLGDYADNLIDLFKQAAKQIRSFRHHSGYRSSPPQ